MQYEGCKINTWSLGYYTDLPPLPLFVNPHNTKNLEICSLNIHNYWITCNIYTACINEAAVSDNWWLKEVVLE